MQLYSSYNPGLYCTNMRMKMYRSVHGLSGSMWSTSMTGTCAVAHHQVSFFSYFVCTLHDSWNWCSLKLFLRLRVEGASRERLCRIIRLEMQWSLQSGWEAKIRALEMQWRWGCHLERLILTGCWTADEGSQAEETRESDYEAPLIQDFRYIQTLRYIHTGRRW